jgi:hypothetical protein
MVIPPSRHFTPLPLETYFNADRARLDGGLRPHSEGVADWSITAACGDQTFHGIPFALGHAERQNVILLGSGAEAADEYQHWMDAIRAGNTFVTVGPLIECSVGGQPAGERLDLPASGGTIDVAWTVASVNVPIDTVEVIVGGLVTEQINVDNQLATSGSASVTVDHSTWVALRVRGSYRGGQGEIAAHTSAVQVIVGGKPLFVEADAMAVLGQIEGAIAYVDTLAPRPEAQRHRQLRATLERAHNRLHQRLHRQGISHRHTPLHRHDAPREH